MLRTQTEPKGGKRAKLIPTIMSTEDPNVLATEILKTALHQHVNDIVNLAKSNDR